MIMTHPSFPPTKQGDIEKSELLDILQTVIDARCGLSAIHQLLDETKSMSDIRERFKQWQTHQCLSQPKQPVSIPDKRANKAYKFVRR